MAATVFGSGNWGAKDESAKGLVVADIALNTTEEVEYLPDHIGEDVGKAMFNQRATVTATGATVARDASGQTVGALMDIADTALYGTETDVTEFHVESSDLTNNQRAFQNGSFTAVGSPGITGVGTEIT